MTSREAILKSGGDEQIASAIEALGYVCVPREPTKEMLYGARWEAITEEAALVWGKMIDISEGTDRPEEEGQLMGVAPLPEFHKAIG